jgi:methyl-accepting chemotaxis protein
MARKIIGISFIVAAIFGLIFSFAGIVLVWSVKAPLTENLTNAIDLIDTTLEATSTGLTVVDETLTKTVSDLTSLENTVQTAANGIDGSVPMVENLSGLLSGSIPQAIEATQTGLTSLQDAAGTVESTLQLLTSIPFLPIESYDPEQSFSDALDDVSQSLDAIPQSLADMEDTLNTTQGNLIMLGAQARIVSRNIAELKSSVFEIQRVLEQYQKVITTAQERMNSLQENLTTIINVSAWIFTIIFIWLGIAQLGLLTQGLERVDWPPAPSAVEGGEPPDTETNSPEDKSQPNAEPIMADEDTPSKPESKDFEE